MLVLAFCTVLTHGIVLDSLSTCASDGHELKVSIMLVMLSEPMESSGMKDTEDYQAGSGGRLTRSHGLASHDLAIQPTWKNRREGNVRYQQTDSIELVL